jgi:hypothetical protein
MPSFIICVVYSKKDARGKSGFSREEQHSKDACLIVANSSAILDHQI